MIEPTIFSDTFYAMGSHCDVVLPNVDADFAKRIFQQIKKEVDLLETTISRHSLVSSIWEFNQAPKSEWIDVEDELWEILSISNDFYQISNGAFDVTVAPLQRLWFEKVQPEEQELETVREKCGFDKIEFDTENQRIRFKQDEMELDFGSIEKGFALDIIRPMLLDEGVKQAIVSFDQDVVLAIGFHPNGESWPIGIRNQQKPNDFLQVFQVSGQTVTTSGTTFIRDDGEGMKSRIVISPATGLPVEGTKTVSVKSASATMGAFISTIWLILPENDKAILADQFSGIEILECEYKENDVITKLTILEKEAE